MSLLAGLLAGVVLALWAPGAVLWLRPALQPLFAVTMFFVGTLVRPSEVRAFTAAPGRALSGLAFQYTIMPLTAFLVFWALMVRITTLITVLITVAV